MSDFDFVEVTEVEDTAITKADVTKTEILSFEDNILVDAKEQGFFATFPVETMADKKRLFAARNDNALLRDHMGEAIEVADFVFDEQKINDPDLGMRVAPCVHIIATDGAAYQSSSTGVVKSAIDIISSFGMPSTWDEPIEVVCKETDTKQGYRYKYLTTI